MFYDANSIGRNGVGCDVGLEKHQMIADIGQSHMFGPKHRDSDAANTSAGAELDKSVPKPTTIAATA